LPVVVAVISLVTCVWEGCRGSNAPPEAAPPSPSAAAPAPAPAPTPSTNTAPGKPTAAKTPDDRGLLRGRAREYALIRLPVRGFSELTLDQKITAYHLYKAALAGRDIAFDQAHRRALIIRKNLEQVLTHSAKVAPEVMTSVRTYADLFWIGNGPYDQRTARKIRSPLTAKTWRAALDAARLAGADIYMGDRDDLDAVMFDMSVQPLMTAKSVRAGGDILEASGGNYYVDVTLADLEGLREFYPLNSRLVKVDGLLIEQVYRTGRDASAGDRPAPSGRYATELGQVVRHLQAAMPHAEPAQQATLAHLVDHFQTGSLESFDKHNVAWLGDTPIVDFSLGFVETYKDPRGVKGEWQGLVSIIDAQAATLVSQILANAQYFERKMPWDDQYKRSKTKPKGFKPIEVLVGVGGAGPSLPAGVDLPNSDAIRAKHGVRSFLLTNALRAIEQAVDEVALDEFALPAERESARRFNALNTDLRVALHETIGHDSGRPSEGLLGKNPAIFLKEYTTALEEARAELVALHLIWDPRMRKIAPECDNQCAETAYRALVRQDLVALNRVGGARIADDHIRATHLIVQYAAARGAVAVQTHSGKRYQVVTSMAKMRTAVAELLAELMRIKAEGDYDAAHKLFQRYALEFDAGLRDEVRRRARRIGLPGAYAFIMPELRAVKTADGRITAVELVEEYDFKTQMLRWRNGPDYF